MPITSRASLTQACPACDERRTYPFYELPDAPVLSNVLCDSVGQARSLARGRISLALCHGCGLIFNRAFEPSAVSYGGHYENALHFSPRFRAFVRELSQHLVQRFGLHRKEIIEVGCGDGQFLASLCRLGRNRGRGYDPSHEPARSALRDDDDVRIAKRELDDYVSRQADMIVCRHVLEHVFDPREFLRSIRKHLRPNAGVYFEVPDARRSLEDDAVWDVIYEHCLYFTAEPMRRLFESIGYTALRIDSRYDGQFLSFEGCVRRPKSADRVGARVIENLDRLTARFGRRHRRLLQLWSDRLEQEHRLGRTTVLWGAGSKGSSFLNTLDPSAELVQSAIDVNPRMHGSYVGGTGHPIHEPKALRHLRPATVIVANPIYLEEIEKTLAHEGLSPELMALGTELD